MATEPVGNSKKDRLERAALLAVLVFVQVSWGAVLVYLAVRFL